MANLALAEMETHLILPGKADTLSVSLAHADAQLSSELAAARADIAQLCDALADVRYTQTVGEMQRIVRLQREVRTRWITKEVRP